MQRTIDEVRVCCPRPDSCEAMVETAILGTHEYDYISDGQTHAIRDEIKAVRLYQEGEGAFAYAQKEGAIAVESGDVCAVGEFNHGTFNWSIFSEGRLVSQLTHIIPRGGLSALASFIKNDELFPVSIRTIDEDLIINAIAFRKLNQEVTYKGVSFQAAFERNVVRWIRSGYNEAKTYWRKAKGRDWVGAINKILCSGGAAALSLYWVEWIRTQANERKAQGDASLLQEALLMEHMANNLCVCPNPRYSNALGMLELEPTITGLVVSVDFGYSTLKKASNTGVLGLMPSSFAVPYSKIHPREISPDSAYIKLKSGPLYDKLKREGQSTNYVFGAAASSLMDAEKVIHNAKEQLIPQTILAALHPSMLNPAESNKKGQQRSIVVTNR